jgi:glycosyltransferase involved in cell wall biosynthesis
MGDNQYKEPLVSIVIGIYNSSPHLGNLFRMLDEQTYQKWQAIFVDDGSTDSSYSILCSKAAKDPRYHILQKAPEGFPSRSRARGLQEAAGELVAFCDHDDFWAPQKLELQVYLMNLLPDISILCTDRVVWQTSDYPASAYLWESPITDIPYRKRRQQDAIFKGLQIVFSSFIGRLTMVKEIGFQQDMKGVDDFYLFARLAQRGSIYQIDLPLTYYYAHTGNLSHHDNIFVKGFYQVHQALVEDGESQQLIDAIFAQALRTEAVSLFASNRRRALRLLLKSLKTYFIPSTLNRLIFLVVTFLIPRFVQQKIFAVVKKLKFQYPTLKDLLPTSKPK